jgi:L-ascorbate metabolism protein UlaG (beta-lactamase superfamily)
VKITLVRNATLLLESSEGRVLVDPMLCDAEAMEPFENTANQVRQPLVGLPFPAQQVVDGVDLCIVTHTHEDHFDEVAQAMLPRDLPIVTQPESADEIRELGFTNVATSHASWPMARGQHGTGEIAEAMGPVSGWIVDGVYIVGDTIWCAEVEDALARHQPRVVIVNGSGARFTEGDPIVMDVDDVRALRAATDAVVVVIHLEVVNHGVEGRDAYRAIPGVLVPDDGETLTL